MDLDIEMGDAAEALQEKYDNEVPRAEDIMQPDEPEEPGEVAEDEPRIDNDDASKTIIPNKVHIRGLDTLHTDDIKAYVKLHYGSVDKVEWIDDTSANLVFGSEPAARDAIVALSSIEIADATALAAGESLPAKPFDGKPEISLHVRFALQDDRKQAGAALRSRYYLLHPEYDPEERRRRQQEGRSRYRDRDRDRDHDRDRDRDSDRHHHRRHGGGGYRRDESDTEGEVFEASMYDDAPRKSRDTRSTERDDDNKPSKSSYTRENQGKELFADRSIGRDRSMRNRSASPRRDRETDDDLISSSSRNNRDKARSIKGRLASDHGSRVKELFPTKESSSTGRSGGGQLDQLEKAIGSAHLREDDMPKIVAIPDMAPSNGLNIRGIASQSSGGNGFSIKGAATAKELFPDKFGAGNSGKELISKRRQRAEDLFS